jgi:hypothetical protein
MKRITDYFNDLSKEERGKLVIHKFVEDVDMYSLDETAETAAAKVNCKVVIPADNQLQLDIDTEEAYNLFLKRVEEFQRISFLHVLVEDTPSKSGLPKRHITLTLFKSDEEPYFLDEWQRITLQTILGSDLIRETLNTWRLIQGEKNPSRLFEPLDNE